MLRKLISWSRKCAYCCGLPNRVGIAPRSAGVAISATLMREVGSGCGGRLAVESSLEGHGDGWAVGVVDVLADQHVTGRVAVGEGGRGREHDGQGCYDKDRREREYRQPAGQAVIDFAQPRAVRTSTITTITRPPPRRRRPSRRTGEGVLRGGS